MKAFVLYHIKNSFLVIRSANYHLVFLWHHRQHHSSLVLLHNCNSFFKLVLYDGLFAKTVFQKKQLLFVDVNFWCIGGSFLNNNVHVRLGVFGVLLYATALSVLIGLSFSLSLSRTSADLHRNLIKRFNLQVSKRVSLNSNCALVNIRRLSCIDLHVIVGF